MNLRRLQFPRHVHRCDEAGSIVDSRLVADVPSCEQAMADGFVVIPPGDFVDDEPPAPVHVPADPVPDPPKRKPGRPPKQQEG